MLKFNIVETKGLFTDPCGTPPLKVKLSEISDWYLTVCFLFFLNNFYSSLKLPQFSDTIRL